MGRSSSTGFPFLVERADAGQFTYHRTLPPHLDGRVTGELVLSWTGATRTLTGRRTIRVSLGTGDRATAGKRWAILHPQVEAQVQLAEVQTRRHHGGGVPADVPRIDPSHIRTIAAQAYHDVLATDDRGEIEPGFATPMARIVLDLARRHRPAHPDGTKFAERAAQTIERRLHVGRIRRRDTAALDTPIQVSELSAADSKHLLDTLKQADRLAPEQIEALALGIRIGEIPSEVDERLKENGLDLPPDHVDRRAIALAITRAKVRALDDVRKRSDGVPIETAERAAVLQVGAPVALEEPVPTLSAMQQAWISDKRPEQKPRDDNALYVGYFVSLFGDLPVSDITRLMIDQYLKLLDRCARNVPHALRRGSLMARVAWSELPDNRGKRRLKRRTINAKGLGSLKACMAQAERLDLVSANPCTGMDLDESVDEFMKRKPYTLADLKKIYSTSVYGQPPVVPKAGCGAAAFWLPLLAMFAGARLEELGQLELADVKVADRIPYLHITDVTDDDDDAAKPEGVAAKSVKTDAARRRVPLHPMLVQLGFLDFVTERRRPGATRLFHELPVYRGRSTKDFSKWWGRFTDQYVTKEPDKTFHSFRHLFIAKLRAAHVPEERIKALVGHQSSDTTLGYGDDGEGAFSLEILLSEVEKISFPGLDLTHLRWVEG